MMASWDGRFGGESKGGLLVYYKMVLENASDISEGVEILTLPCEVVVIGVTRLKEKDSTCGRERMDCNQTRECTLILTFA